MRNYLAGLLLPVLLAGCALPPAVTVASTFADGVSYAVSGKGMADHALSAITSSDCAFIRALDDRDICTDYAGEEMPQVLIASAPEVGAWMRVEESVTSGTLAAGGARAAAPTAPAQPRPAELASAADSAGSAASPGRDAWVTVVGSYRDYDNAIEARLRLTPLQPRIVTATVGGRTVYRLVSDVPVRQARAAGVGDAWSMPLGRRRSTKL